MEVVNCGFYFEDGVPTQVYCDPDTGDVILDGVSTGRILLDNLVITDPDMLPEERLVALAERLGANGIIVTRQYFIALHDNCAKFYPRFSATGLVLQKTVPVGYDISYDEDVTFDIKESM